MSSGNGESSTSNGGKGMKRTTVQHQQLPARPKLVPQYPSAETPRPPVSAFHDEEPVCLPFSLSGLTQPTSESGEWVSVITAPAYAPFESWLNVMQSLIRHPERNSSNILRADILSETCAQQDEGGGKQGGWKKQWTIRRALLPRRPNLDWRMEQDCSLHYRLHPHSAGEEHGEEGVEEAVVIYTPLIGAESHPKMTIPEEGRGGLGQPLPTEAYIPFYHPKVRALAFHYHPHPSSSTGNTEEPTVYGRLSISLIPFPPTTSSQPEPFPTTHRLTRVALSLITTLHTHTWGDLHSYQKRVHHDQIVPRTLYQDLYLSLKPKYASELIAGWAEATDPTKHVFEEMGIAAFLISLWSLEYGKEEGWKGRVKFVDVGCGNGLLTYILSREGFSGVGLDLRARKSWVNYSSKGAMLKEWTFTPASLLQHRDEEGRDVWEGAFLIGNHADELTPWIPVLATHNNCAGFINLPCCYYGLDGTRDFPLLLKGKGEAVSRNEQYLAYVSMLHERFGWNLESEALRIPSTKNWCFVGRTWLPTSTGDQGREVMRDRIQEAIQQALTRGWAARTSTK
ncbi:related to TRM44-tRNA(Ser) Um(44) 2'-O-methyltransferase [Ustilago bromivora]|uniref:tRNA (uracil-O(2)-)-methyltransferase n=1 Tax=Ustilago bromivora TaxID=307758 RepID=A0A1K0FV42_9BASI|nr:related to TRM44-tRNA(Ser) Um(44) 2'-O-methyltransferase [Ustilago bromivora]SYW77346.1 related to TRM44 - tRNA(Ser) Um(44) 2'-O-methyltransferase [Ustilago bromivora]